MSQRFKQRLDLFNNPEDRALLRDIQRGVEKESLRVREDGKLAQTAHPEGLGSALTNGHITTDYSEALLEFITPVDTSIDATLDTLSDIHRFVYAQLDDELLWGASMPCLMEGDEAIPVAHYGSSNVAQMKTVYRNGLGHRYGRLMQTIAGIHYNFSMPAAFWEHSWQADGAKGSLQDYITERYLGLIRNFQRHSWLLIYLFGASPAICRSFVRNNPNHGLDPFDEQGRSLYKPWGTSLRMGDLGYQSNAQNGLEICYNQLDTYIDTLHSAITRSHPEYETIGLGDAGARKQLNTSLLQIENEFYSPIRPKRVTQSGEIPLGALKRSGIEYIEVRCIDINPFMPLGIDASQMRFVDAFLLFCLMEDSPPCTSQERSIMSENTSRIVNRGREPGLQLLDFEGQDIALATAGNAILDQVRACSDLLDNAHTTADYSQSLATQQAKIEDAGLTPSAQILQQMSEQDIPWFRLAMNASLQWAEHFREQPLNTDREAYFEQAARQSK